MLHAPIRCAARYMLLEERPAAHPSCPDARADRLSCMRYSHRRHSVARCAALSLLATCALLLAHRASAQEETRPRSEMRTSATARRFVRPDVAIVKFSIAAEGETPRDAGRALAARSDSLRRAFGKIGIPGDSIITASRWYLWRGRIESVQGSRCVPLPQRTPDGRTCMMVNDTTYRAHDAIEVHVDDIGKVGAVLDSVMAYQVIDISELQFRATDVTAAYEDALKEAAATARRQADAVAGASGARVGRVLSLSTYDDPSRTFQPAAVVGMNVDSMRSRGGPGTTVIEPSITVTATVWARWELIGDQ